MAAANTRNLFTLGLLAAALAGCATTPPPEPPAPEPAIESGPLAPSVGDNNLELNRDKVVYCTEGELAAAAAKLNDAALIDALKIRRYYFDTDKSDLDQAAGISLGAHTALLARQTGLNLQLTGHTDERGTQDYNLALGERRANAVARYLVSAGVRNEQVKVVSYGKEKPAALGSTEEAWAQNRRVELAYSGCAR